MPNFYFGKLNDEYESLTKTYVDNFEAAIKFIKAGSSKAKPNQRGRTYSSGDCNAAIFKRLFLIKTLREYQYF